MTFGADTTQREFASLDAFAAWFSSERARWEWLTPGDPTLNPGNVAGMVTGQYTEVLNLIETARTQPDPISFITPQLESRWAINGYLRLSEGQWGATLLDIREAAGDEAAAFAYAFLIQQVNMGSATKPTQLVGAMLLALPDMTSATDLAQRLSRERSNYKAAQSSAITKLERAHEEQAERVVNMIARARRVARRVLRSRYDNWNKVRDDWKVEADKSKAEIDAVRVAYEESMHLQGPVKYWSRKARAHGTNEKWATAYVILFFIVGAVVLVCAFSAAADFIATSSRDAIKLRTQPPTALYVLVTGGLAALSTLVFWIGRLLTKLWMSEHHLRNDAHERAVMTTTYLALTRTDKAEDIDRQIILNALFRSTPDGIVKEEGSELGLQALAAKYLSRP